MNKEKENLCSSCKHEKMCKFKKGFIIAEKEFYKKAVDENEVFEEEDLIKIDINCKFYSTLESKRTVDITSSPFNPPYTLKRDDACENCEWRKSLLTRTTPYVGDSPCEWCMHNKFKVTCDYNTISNKIK